jgi:hypothetical protein
MLLGLACLSVSPFLLTAQAPPTKANVRDCKPGSDHVLGKKRSTQSKKKGATAELPLMPSCLEVQDSAISIQEYLQAAVREFRWNVADEQASEDLWSFSIYLGADSVAAFTKPPADPRIAWTGGKANVNVRTNPLPDGFTRVIVTARFDGFGEPEDKFAPQRSSWPLPSSGAWSLAQLPCETGYTRL